MSNWQTHLLQRPVQIALALIVLVGLAIGLSSVQDRITRRLDVIIPPGPTVTPVVKIERTGGAVFLPHVESNTPPLVSAPTPAARDESPSDSTTEAIDIPLTPIALAAVALASIVFVWLLPAAALPVLIFATALDRFRFDVVTLGVRIEHLALFAVAVVWGINFLRRRAHFRLAWDDALLALYWFIALIASFLNAPSLLESLKFLGLMGLAFFVYWLVKALVTDEKTFRRAFVALLVVGAGEALYGIAAWVLMPWGINLGIQFYPYGPNPGYDISCRNFTYSPYGTLFESNIFGSYTMGITLVALALWLSPQFRLGKRWLLATIVVGTLAVALSLTRGALAAFVLGAFALVLFAEGGWMDRLKASALALFILALAVFGSTELAERLIRSPSSPVSFRLSTECVRMNRPPALVVTPEPSASPTPVASNSGDLILSRLLASESIGYRLDTYRRAFDDWLDHPWIGNGANVFAQRYITTSRTRDWISNVELMALHDTGIIGLSVLLLLFFLLGRDLVRALRSGSPGFTRAALLGMAISFIGLLAAYQVTTAFWLGFTWVQFGLMRAGTLLLRDQSNAAQVL